MSASRFTLASGYEISRVIKGGWQLAGGHGPIEEAIALADMGAYVAAGIDTFDCADIYTGVEALIGRFRRQAPAPFRVHTKFVPDLSALATIDRAGVRALIARSAARLGTDCLDLVQFHWWDHAIPRHVEIARYLAELQDEGLITLLGGTNFDTEATQAMIDAGIRLSTMQVQYSVLDDRPARGLGKLAARSGMRLLAYGTVAGGFLGEAWHGAPEPKASLENRSLVKYKLIIDDTGGWDHLQHLLDTLAGVAARHATDIASIASRFVLDQPGVAAVIVGARDRRHLDQHGRLARITLDATDHDTIAAAIASGAPLAGDVYELERDRHGRHGRIMRYDLNDQTTTRRGAA